VRPALLAGLLDAEQASAAVLRTIKHLADHALEPEFRLDLELLEMIAATARTWHDTLHRLVLRLAGLGHLVDPNAEHDESASHDPELHLLASLVDTLQASHELNRTLAEARDEVRRSHRPTEAIARCVDLARQVFAATLRIQERVESASRGA
jgi:hypothetical protein